MIVLVAAMPLFAIRMRRMSLLPPRAVTYDIMRSSSVSVAAIGSATAARMVDERGTATGAGRWTTGMLAAERGAETPVRIHEPSKKPRAKNGSMRGCENSTQRGERESTAAVVSTSNSARVVLF